MFPGRDANQRIVNGSSSDTKSRKLSYDAG